LALLRIKRAFMEFLPTMLIRTLYYKETIYMIAMVLPAADLLQGATPHEKEFRCASESQTVSSDDTGCQKLAPAGIGSDIRPRQLFGDGSETLEMSASGRL
jgi:hypothetical protein